MHVTKDIGYYFPVCRIIAGEQAWHQLTALTKHLQSPSDFPDSVTTFLKKMELPGYFAELAKLEWAYRSLTADSRPLPDTDTVESITLNPSLQLQHLTWRGLLPLLLSPGNPGNKSPQSGEEFILTWIEAKSGKVHIREATGEDLLVLKMIAEEIEPLEAAAAGKIPVGMLDAALDRAVQNGLLLAPPSLIKRDPSKFKAHNKAEQRFLNADFFTLQWHITQKCDLHCKHCYDRSSRTPLHLKQGVAILDELRDFIRSRHVKGQITFTGGNPLLHPEFTELYQAAADRGLTIAILGNPAPRQRIKELLRIKKPAFFQVSLEGLPDHNDYIRGHGHFARVMEFLDTLRELKIHSMVMLTLTRDNMNQVLPLAEILKNKVDDFNFSRLSMVGEGAKLLLPEPESYRNFLQEYLLAAKTNPVMRLKDNLINIIRLERGEPLFGGCAGHGCGAAFNFLCVLPDGEVHACRKFPSPIGNIYEQSLATIYDSGLAERYRSGCKECTDCRLRLVCGGCLAISHSHRLDIFEARDPFCFIGDRK